MAAAHRSRVPLGYASQWVYPFAPPVVSNDVESLDKECFLGRTDEGSRKMEPGCECAFKQKSKTPDETKTKYYHPYYSTNKKFQHDQGGVFSPNLDLFILLYVLARSWLERPAVWSQLSEQHTPPLCGFCLCHEHLINI
ncbi:hypothetical protein MG293_010516 [Ovis ammon polii]|uniref:Uncharacterized protein n=1 Tax=Ovis ammon polii TaxID=230172 RepID=A0AAD4Y8W9_OVIAM|nr:hypothetical protein MG293_010516 [Ovis ammon polii]